ncbi:hypothetical protein PPERSA_09094 [Pseudocohnilembus persalinus]|uniref:Uncharacterized protein n=1 Tax=Pseudocohnilembus persalinus TaxID=266149 RepID=A0A0V0Q9A0_PSEPJ|nr:hypothetical protein PPERSA_09094 [Pseudocohnilembus persalinus]|eukprot:KRW98599.1 hypothetical protein PPERSA_09094 [Pseudocohnilembus persalinus]
MQMENMNELTQVVTQQYRNQQNLPNQALGREQFLEYLLTFDNEAESVPYLFIINGEQTGGNFSKSLKASLRNLKIYKIDDGRGTYYGILPKAWDLAGQNFQHFYQLLRERIAGVAQQSGGIAHLIITRAFVYNDVALLNQELPESI